MDESQRGGATLRGRVAVTAIVTVVALAGVGTFAIGGSSAAGAGDAEGWSPYPGKEVTPDCPPTNETTPDNGTIDDGTDVSGYQLVINYTEAWQGTIVTEDMNMPIEGTGNETIDIEADENESVAATLSKANITSETMNVSLLLDGEVVDNQDPVEPTVDNFDRTDDASTVESSSSGFDDSTSEFESTSNDSTFESTSDSGSFNETGTDDGWSTFGEENESSTFEGSASAQENDDPFNGSEITTSGSDYQIRVAYSGDWSGTIGDVGSTRSVEGSGTESFDIDVQSGDIVSANAQKDDDSNDELTIQILRDGDVIKETSTTAEFGVASVSATLNGTQAVIAETDGNDTYATSSADDTSDVDDGNETTDDECVETKNTTQPTNDPVETSTTETNDSALALSTSGDAQVVFADQNVTETSLVVESATLPDGGFVVIHNMSLMQDGGVENSVVGVSEKLDAEQNEDIEVNLTPTEGIEESQTLIAVAYRDTDGDGEFEYDGTEGGTDEPYRDDNGSAVSDDAYVTVIGDENTTGEAGTYSENTTTASTEEASVFTETETRTATATEESRTAMSSPTTAEGAMSGNAAEQSTETNAPGFGLGIAVVAMLGAALLTTRAR